MLLVISACEHAHGMSIAKLRRLPERQSDSSEMSPFPARKRLQLVWFSCVRKCEIYVWNERHCEGLENPYVPNSNLVRRDFEFGTYQISVYCVGIFSGMCPASFFAALPIDFSHDKTTFLSWWKTISIMSILFFHRDGKRKDDLPYLETDLQNEKENLQKCRCSLSYSWKTDRKTGASAFVATLPARRWC